MHCDLIKYDNYYSCDLTDKAANKVMTILKIVKICGYNLY